MPRSHQSGPMFAKILEGGEGYMVQILHSPSARRQDPGRALGPGLVFRIFGYIKKGAYSVVAYSNEKTKLLNPYGYEIEYSQDDIDAADRELEPMKVVGSDGYVTLCFPDLRITSSGRRQTFEAEIFEPSNDDPENPTSMFLMAVRTDQISVR